MTLVEFADLQCPFCAEWSQRTLPVLVERFVKQGKLRIVFSGMAFLGPDSDTALRTAIVAARENHLWDIVHGLYEAQGAENSGWVTDDLVRDISRGTRGLDARLLLRTRFDDDVTAEVDRTIASAHAAGITGTPSFLVGRTGGKLTPLQLTSLGPEGIVPVVKAALAR